MHIGEFKSSALKSPMNNAGILDDINARITANRLEQEEFSLPLQATMSTLGSIGARIGFGSRNKVEDEPRDGKGELSWSPYYTISYIHCLYTIYYTL